MRRYVWLLLAVILSGCSADAQPFVSPLAAVPFDTPLYAANGILTAASRAYARPRGEE